MKMKKTKWKRLIMLSCLMIAGLFFFHTDCYAKSEAQKAISAYRKILTADQFYWTDTASISTDLLEFYVMDLNKDGIKELYIYSPQQPGWGRLEGCCKVFTYKNGKTKCILTTIGLSVYKKAKVIEASSISCGIDEGYYYKITKSGNLSEKMSYVKQNAPVLEGAKYIEYADDGEWYYTSCKVGKKEVSWSKYKKSLRKLLADSSEKSIPFKKNTSQNRKKYLK